MEAVQEQTDSKKFDLIVHHRDPVTGLVVKTDPYILRVVGEPGSHEKSSYFERPAGSGNLFTKENLPCGRWVYEEKTVKGRKLKVGKYEPEAAHVEFVRPLTQDQKLAQSLIESDRRNAALEAELAALRAESEKKPSGKKQAEPGA